MQPIIELKSELEGIVKLEIIKEDGTLKEAEGLNIPFKNLITNAGLNFVSGYFKVSYAARYCKVGTSSVPPNVSDTSLISPVGSSAYSAEWDVTNKIQYTTAPYYSEHTKVYTFAVGSVSGNLTEIGFFSDASGGTMWSRALIKDSGGNPTTLTLLATEQLKVTYTVRRYIPTSLTGSFILNTNGTNNSVNYTITPANINETLAPWVSGYISGNSNMYIWAYETQSLGAITSRPAGSESSVVTGTGSYINGSFEKTFSVTVPVATANFTTGIGSLVFWIGSSDGGPFLAGYQCSFSPKIMKTSSQTLAIGIKLSWGRTTQQ